jgi:hypothetical protein
MSRVFYLSRTSFTLGTKVTISFSPPLGAGSYYAFFKTTSSLPGPADIHVQLNVDPFTFGLYFIVPSGLTSGQHYLSVFSSTNPGSGNVISNPQNQNPTGPPFYTYISPPSPPPPCFKSGSKILTDQGYKPVEDLRKGDLVKTLLNGYLPIIMIGKKDIVHHASSERIKDQLYVCSQANYPEVWEDLVLTGCHSILVDGFVNEKQREKTIEINGDIYATDAKCRVPAAADERASVYDKPGTYTIYHLALENDDYYMNYGIYANGLLVETCSKRYLKELSNMELIDN